MSHLILPGLAWLAAYVLLVWWRPHKRRCPKCKGKRVLFEGGDRPRTCPRCKGTGGPVRRYGAPLVHRAYQSLAGDSLRERRRERLKTEPGAEVPQMRRRRKAAGPGVEVRRRRLQGEDSAAAARAMRRWARPPLRPARPAPQG